MSQPPRVSVIVPNYNHEAFLPERLDSIFAQTYQDFELILLDDASTDGSLDVLNRYAERPQVRLFVNETNSGSPFHQWNRGVAEARGEYVWIAESDDTARPEFLERLVAILDDHTSVDLVECGSRRIDEAGTDLGPLSRDVSEDAAERWNSDFEIDGRDEIKRFLYVQNTIPSASAVLFRRATFLEAGPADDSFKLAGDWWQWIKILSLCDFYFCAEPLSFTRIHQQTQRQSSARSGLLELEAIRVQRQCRGVINIGRPTIRRGAERYATSWIQGVRSGRYRGPFTSHVEFFHDLSLTDQVVALQFAVRMPYAMIAWVLKNTLFRSRRDIS